MKRLPRYFQRLMVLFIALFLITACKNGETSDDSSGNSTTVPDTTSPVVGNSGTITVVSTTDTSITLEWTQATDNKSAAGNLTYTVYYSRDTSMDSLPDLQSYGTVDASMDGTSDATTLQHTIGGLVDGYTYTMNLSVTDEKGNTSVYTKVSQFLPDVTAPVAGNDGTITIDATTDTSLTIGWTQASDIISAQQNLKYSVYYATDTTLDSLSEIQTNGTFDATVDGTTASTLQYTLSGLNDGYTYTVNLVVWDEAGNAAVYTKTSNAFQDITAPTVSNSTISIDASTDTSVTIGWTQATDNVATKENLTYTVYYATTTTLDTLADIQANGTVDATVDGTADSETLQHTVSGLTDGYTYTLNLVVTDPSGNTSVYSKVSKSLADVTAPAPGSGGTFSIPSLSVTGSSVTLEWTAATDTISDPSALQYQVYKSESNNIGTVSTLKTNGTAVRSFTADITSDTVSDLEDAVQYWFNILVKDEAGNEAVYVAQSATTLDTTSPSPGTLSIDGSADTSLSVGWSQATDNWETQANLDYRLYYSTTDNIGSLAAILSNGTAADSTVDASASPITVSGLTNGQTYWFNLIVADSAGNSAVYSSISGKTVDVDPPTVADGTITPSAQTGSSVNLSWSKATDNSTAQADLQYLVYRSTSSNIDTTTDMTGNGTAVGSFAADLSNKTVSGLDDATTYFFNVMVKDETGNASAYTTVSATTNDITPPTPGTLSVDSSSDDSVTLAWTGSTDNGTGTLSYRIFTSTSDNINSVNTLLSNGTAFDATMDTVQSPKTVTGLSDGVRTYFNILVVDAEGNQAVYTTVSEKTIDVTSPTPGNSGTIAASDITTDALTLTWTTATDNSTPDASLDYLVYQSTSDYIDSTADMEANGTPLSSFTANLSTQAVTGLNDGTTYYFNVMVKDETGNKAAYSRLSATTVDATPPTVSNGTLSVLNTDTSTDSLTVTWHPALDNLTLEENLQYRVCDSTSDDLSTVSAISEGLTGTTTSCTAYAMATGYDVSGDGSISTTITNLQTTTLYRFNVEVKDEAGLEAVFTNTSVATGLDGTVDIAAKKFNGDGTAYYNDITIFSNDLAIIPQKNGSNEGYFTIWDASGENHTTATEFMSISGNSVSYISSTLLNNDSVLIAHNDYTDSLGKFSVFNSSGTNQNINKTFNINGTSSYISALTLTGGRVLIAYQDSDNGGDFVIYSETGVTEIRAETPINAAATTYLSATALKNGNAFIAFNNNGTIGQFAIYDPTGDVVKTATDITGSGNATYISAVTMANGNVLVAYKDGDDLQGKFFIYDSSGNVVRSETAFHSTDVTDFISAVALSNGDVLIAYKDTNDGANGHYVIVNQSGIVIRTEAVFCDTLSKIESIHTAAFSNNKVIIVFHNNTMGGDGYLVIVD